MKNRIGKTKVALFAALMIAGLSLAAQGASTGKPADKSAGASAHRTVELTAGQASTVDLGRPVADILVANPAVADVGTMRSSRLYIVGKTVGDTNVLAFDAAGNQLADIGVRVSVDGATIRSTLKKFFPRENIDARTVKNDIVLTGTVSTPIVANQVRDLASRFLAAGAGQTLVDLMKVDGDQQVMLKVKIVEAKRDILREYGFTPSFRPGSAGSDSNLVGLPGSGLAAAATPFATGQLFIRDNRFGPLEIELRALEKDGLLNTLAEPNLTAISGETAGFLAGGEFPVPTGRDTNGNITLEFKKFGVALNFTPTVLSNDRISLQLTTEVSEKSTENSVTLVNTIIPGLNVRRAETTVQMGSGGTVMIAGLIKSSDAHNFTGLPGMKDVPILGELFKSKSFSRNETELVILVTPYLVTPFADPQAVDVSGGTVVPSALTTPAPLPLAPQKRSDAGGTVPVRAADAGAYPVPAVERQALTQGEMHASLPGGGHPLSQSFVDNLRRVYGRKAPPNAAPGAPFGYIVD